MTNENTTNDAESTTPKRTHRATGKKTTGTVGRITRYVLPAIPLGIALVHGTLAHKTTPPPQTPVGTTLSAPVAAMDGCGVDVPCPMVSKGTPAQWWFVFKLNAKAFPGCGGGADRNCIFGGQAESYAFGQQYLYASDASPALKQGASQCLGDSTNDPVGASFDEVYNGNFYYVVWNDQPYGDPSIQNHTSKSNFDAPWGHSKGIVAWNEDGEGFVMQVSTPSWPAAGSKEHPRRTDGNTLGCINDDNVTFSQHFFALRLTHSDLVQVLNGLQNASVVTDPGNPQVVNNGGPNDVQSLVSTLGKLSTSGNVVEGKLSSGLTFISKPSNLNVPPWQMVSAELGGVNLRTATFWAKPEIPSTTTATQPDCWSPSLGTPGQVLIVKNGSWNGTTFDLTGTIGANHAKLGVGMETDSPIAVFGDENQQGTLSGNCKSSQNGRGGTYYVLSNSTFASSLRNLLSGEVAPAATDDQTESAK